MVRAPGEGISQNPFWIDPETLSVGQRVLREKLVSKRFKIPSSLHEVGVRRKDIGLCNMGRVKVMMRFVKEIESLEIVPEELRPASIPSS